MGILNSRLFVFVYRLLALESGRVLAQVKPTIVAQLPIRTVDLSKKGEKDQHDRIVSLVKQRIELHAKLAVAKTASEETSFERQIAANEMSINNTVYVSL